MVPRSTKTAREFVRDSRMPPALIRFRVMPETSRSSVAWYFKGPIGGTRDIISRGIGQSLKSMYPIGNDSEEKLWIFLLLENSFWKPEF